MDLRNSLSVSSTSDLTRQITELCRATTLPGTYETRHLPTDLRNELDGYERQMQYHLGQALAIYQQKSTELQVKMEQWWNTAYFYDPTELLGDAKWENFYPGVVVSEKPYRDFREAEANSEAEQRYLTTQLITGAITKKRLDSILRTAQGLVCALDPREDVFFNEETLQECLEAEKLTTPKAVNAVLGRKPYTQIKKSDRRDALAKIWTERRGQTLQRNQFLSEDWEREDAAFQTVDAVRAFTLLVFREIANSIDGYGAKDIDTAIWEVLREATAEGDEENYYLDPRDEDTWAGIRDIANAIKQADTEQHHSDYQSGIHTGQEWMRTEGLPALYGASADWWETHPNIPTDPCAADKLELLLTKTRRSPYEEVQLFKRFYEDSVKASNLLPLANDKYGNAIREVLRNA